MAGVVFDFDSTLIDRESLEFIIAEYCGIDSVTMERIRAIGAAGMGGTIGFRDSLAQRLALAQPYKADVERFGLTAVSFLTPGIGNLIDNLHAAGHAVYIVSGGFYEAILPSAAALGIRATYVHAVRARWGTDGRFAGLDAGDLFSVSKVQGLRALPVEPVQPLIVVGDGMTDYELYAAGAARDFVAFTQHVRRREVVELAPREARTVEELRSILELIL